MRRQSGPHAHSPTCRRTAAAVCGGTGARPDSDLRLDAVNRRLSPGDPALRKSSPGRGRATWRLGDGRSPMHQRNVATVRRSATTPPAGTLQELQTAQVRRGHDRAKEQRGDRGRSGRASLYASNRGTAPSRYFSMAIRARTPVERVSTQGKTPRNFAIDRAERLCRANQDSGNVGCSRSMQPRGDDSGGKVLDWRLRSARFRGSALSPTLWGRPFRPIPHTF